MTFGYSSSPLPADLSRLVSSADQLCNVEMFTRQSGPGAGSPVLEVHNPKGISFEVLADRCMDIGWADAYGIPLGWRSSRGNIASGFVEPTGDGWCRTFPGGLLSTCGLESTGLASSVGNRKYGLHGRIGHIPVDNLTWKLDRSASGSTCIVIDGDALEAGLGSPSLRLHRTISADIESPRLVVEDTVENLGFSLAGHMMRHHITLGYPIIQPGSVVTSQSVICGHRGDDGVNGRSLPWTLGACDAPQDEEVYYCNPTQPDQCKTTVTSPLDQSLTVVQDVDSWPMLVLWRDASPGVNVFAIEPSTSKDGGRWQAERDGEVIWLEPGSIRHYHTEIYMEL
ncbi:DUF4432 family protein [Bifidobacterium sp. ESL0732]|uniref:DUF4432 family protein n=1 Tax=Bifidobacterium sp. ESL0732 TaxID=2983222 RepID=UPI0023F664DB|nr:DUF4432 family protein [Bifidobacterium sp. ESL0732]WEV63817.1 DUF4432 family protein [Bifidobacterium sp. ESL0732]